MDLSDVECELPMVTLKVTERAEERDDFTWLQSVQDPSAKIEGMGCVPSWRRFPLGETRDAPH